MNKITPSIYFFQGVGRSRLGPGPICQGLFALWLIFHAAPAQASIFKGETLDKVADVISWVVLVVAPIVAIAVFWLIHILPEKIAERRKHPQAKAIQTLCLLSLFFGGLLWPLAWLWAYSRPVFYKMAYGTDTVEHEHGVKAAQVPAEADAEEAQRLRARVAELEAQVAMQHKAAEGGHY